MEIIKKIAAKSQNRWEHKIPTIAFLGDSVTPGVFETYEKGINKVYTANYTLVQAAGKDMRNRLVSVLLTDVLQDTMIGEVLE